MLPRDDALITTPLAYENHGYGPPLLLLHGALVSRTYWRPQIAAFTPHYRVITCDLPGHGESGLLDRPTSVAYFAAKVLALLDHLGAPQVICAGHSMGGMVAQELALLAPERVAALVLVDTWYDPKGEIWEPFPFRTLFLKWLLLATRTEDMITWRAYASGLYNPAVTLYALQEMKRHATQRENYMRIWDAAMDFSSRYRLEHIRCPTLVLVSEAFTFTQLQAQVMRRRIHDAELAVIPRSGHWVNWDNPAAFNRAVLSFLTRRAPSTLSVTERHYPA